MAKNLTLSNGLRSIQEPFDFLINPFLDNRENHSSRFNECIRFNETNDISAIHLRLINTKNIHSQIGLINIK